MVNTVSSDFTEFADKLIVKTRGRQDYFYVTLKNNFTNQTKLYYIGKYTEDEQKLFEYYLKLSFNQIKEAFELVLNANYTSKYLTSVEAKFLELIRFSYFFGLRDYSKTDLERYEEAKYTEYVYGTTSVEGNTYTLLETGITLNDGLTVTGKTNREFYEIDNYSSLKKYTDRLQKPTYSKDFICKIHEFVMRNIDDESAGEFRNIDVGIRRSEFRPTPAIMVEIELDELLQWYEENREKLYPLELIAIFHERFEAIHPFKDGNGRVGRELLRLQLRDFDFPSIFISKENREHYIKSLAKSGEDSYLPIIAFVIEQVVVEYIDLSNAMLDYIKDVITAVHPEKVNEDEILSNSTLREVFIPLQTKFEGLDEAYQRLITKFATEMFEWLEYVVPNFLENFMEIESAGEKDE